MSYVDEVIDLVVKKNPAEPEFHQAVKEVLDSLKLVIDANEEKYRKAGIQQEIRKREHYEKPSVRRKKKSEAARKRKYN